MNIANLTKNLRRSSLFSAKANKPKKEEPESSIDDVKIIKIHQKIKLHIRQSGFILTAEDCKEDKASIEIDFNADIRCCEGIL